MSHSVYILRCADDTLYTGYTTDIEKRLQEHNGIGATVTARSAGAKYTKPRRPVKMVYSEDFENRSEAMQREYAIKQLSRAEKLALIQGKQNNIHMAKGQDRKKEIKKPKKDKIK